MAFLRPGVAAVRSLANAVIEKLDKRGDEIASFPDVKAIKDEVAAMISVEQSLKEAQSAFQNGNAAEAELQSREILRAHPTNAPALTLLALTVSDRGDEPEYRRLLRHAIFCDRSFPGAYNPLARAYYSLGRTAEAADVYTAWSEVEPGNPEVVHMIAATTGLGVPPRASDAFVHALFNKFAENFDKILVQGLEYRGPELITTMMTRHVCANLGDLTVLDAGCGTGLCGSLLRPSAKTLVGVDIAEEMIERARNRGCYDELAVSELSAFMNSRASAFDVIVSSDVLVYFGDLKPPMRAAHGALRDGGVLAFNVEALLDSGPEPFQLTASGRYSHRDSYLRDVLSQAGFTVLEIELDWVRWEKGKQVMFHSVCAQRKA